MFRILRFPEIGNRPAVTQARGGLAYLWVGVLGHSGRVLAAPLGIRPTAVYKAVRRGGATPARWLRLLAQD